MNDKLNEPNVGSDPENEIPEPEQKQSGGNDVVYEENDGWQFEAEAPTLSDTVIDNEEFQINIPNDKPAPSSGKAANTYSPASKTYASAADTSVKKKKSGNTALFILTAVFVAAIIVVLIVLGIGYYTVPNSDEKMNPGNVAMTVGDTDISIGMYNYYYNGISQQYISYASSGYYDLDTGIDYSKQTTTDSEGKTTTWANIFVNDTVEQIKFITAYYEEGVEKGVTLTEKQKENIETQLSTLKESASDSDMSVDEYISENFGEYCGYATIKKMFVQAYTAMNYYQQKLIDEKVTDEETEAYYQEHADDYSEVPFAYLQIPYEQETQAETLKKAQNYAEQIKSVNDLKKLIPTAYSDLIQQYVDYGYYNDNDSAAEALAESVETSIIKSDTSFTQEGMTWLFSNDTKVGDCSTFVDETNYVIYVVLKTGEPAVSDDELYSVRHILIMPEKADGEEAETDTDTDTGQTIYTDEEWAAAEAEAEKILDEYNSGDKTEYSFALLAEKYSEDTESTSSGSSGLFGGLYAGTALGTMVPEFEEWSTDASRKYGDVEIVKSDYGYHIMYFVEDTEEYFYNCEQAVITEKEEKFVDSMEVKKHKKAMSKTTVAKPVASSSDDSDDMNY